MKKILLVLIAVIALGAGSAGVADAHYIMHSYEAQFYGQQIAADDCNYRNAGWSCSAFPTYNSVWAVSDHTWRVQVGWRMTSWWGATNSCYTETDWSHGALTGHRVSAGC